MFKLSIPLSKRYNTAIEIGKNYLKIAQAEVSNKGIRISRLITEPVAGLSDEDISKLLTDTMGNSLRSDSLISVISRKRTMVRYIRLPATSPEEIESMVSFEIDKQIPYSKEEVVSDYKIIDVDDEGYSNIMLVVAHKDEITRINTIFESAGAGPQKVRLSSEATLGWLNSSLSEEEREGKSTCLIEIDTNNTEIVMVSDGKLGFSRVASIGANDILESAPERDAHKRRLMDEIKHSIAMYIKERGKGALAISQFVVSGAHSVIEDFSNTLKDQVEELCRPLNILSTLDLIDGALSDEGVSTDSSVCAVCGSLFLSEGINLIPQDLRNKQKIQTKLKKAVAVLISTAVVVSLLFSVLLIKLYQKRSLLKQLNTMLEAIEPTADATEARLKKIRVLKSQLSEGASSLDVIYHLYRLIPANISLIDFDYDDSSGIVRFRGRALRMSDVFKLTTMLDESERFGNVDTRSVAKRRTREGEIVDFQLRCSFIPQGVKE